MPCTPRTWPSIRRRRFWSWSLVAEYPWVWEVAVSMPRTVAIPQWGINPSSIPPLPEPCRQRRNRAAGGLLRRHQHRVGRGGRDGLGADRVEARGEVARERPHAHRAHRLAGERE